MRKLILLALLHLSPVFADEIRVGAPRLQLGAEQAVFQADTEFNLGDPVREALLNAIPVTFAWDLRLVDERTLLPDEILWSAEGSFRLSYRSLSRRYTIVQTDTGVERSFPDLDSALGDLRAVRLRLPPLDRVLTAGGRTRLQFRYHLDIAALPPSLRLPAYLSRAWRLDSGWISTADFLAPADLAGGG